MYPPTTPLLFPSPSPRLLLDDQLSHWITGNAVAAGESGSALTVQ